MFLKNLRIFARFYETNLNNAFSLKAQAELSKAGQSLLELAKARFSWDEQRSDTSER